MNAETLCRTAWKQVRGEWTLVKVVAQESNKMSLPKYLDPMKTRPSSATKARKAQVVATAGVATTSGVVTSAGGKTKAPAGAKK
jgi:hypothetical protein